MERDTIFISVTAVSFAVICWAMFLDEFPPPPPPAAVYTPAGPVHAIGLGNAVPWVPWYRGSLVVEDVQVLARPVEAVEVHPDTSPDSKPDRDFEDFVII
jgi:hypothetical protein